VCSSEMLVTINQIARCHIPMCIPVLGRTVIIFRTSVQVCWLVIYVAIVMRSLIICINRIQSVDIEWLPFSLIFRGSGIHISARRPAILIEVYRGFLKLLLTNCKACHILGHCPFLPYSFQFTIHQSLYPPALLPELLQA
jgi:hypothetical protein